MTDLSILLAGVGLFLVILVIPAYIAERTGWAERYEARWRREEPWTWTPRGGRR